MFNIFEHFPSTLEHCLFKIRDNDFEGVRLATKLVQYNLNHLLIGFGLFVWKEEPTNRDPFAPCFGNCHAHIELGKRCRTGLKGPIEQWCTKGIQNVCPPITHEHHYALGLGFIYPVLEGDEVTIVSCLDIWNILSSYIVFLCFWQPLGGD